MSSVLRHLSHQNDLYCADFGIHQSLYRGMITTLVERDRASLKQVMANAPTIDHSHLYTYAITALGICPVEQESGLKTLFQETLTCPKAQMPFISVALEGLHVELAVFDPGLADKTIESMLASLKPEQLTSLLSAGAKSEKAAKRRLGEPVISAAFSDRLVRHFEGRPASEHSLITPSTARAIYSRHDCKLALGKAGAKAGTRTLMEDLGL